MIDTGRRFYPVALVKQTIDGMAMTKQKLAPHNTVIPLFEIGVSTRALP